MIRVQRSKQGNKEEEIVEKIEDKPSLMIPFIAIQVISNKTRLSKSR